MDIFQETIFRPLGGAVPKFFLYALEIDLGYLAHTPTGTGVPPPKKNSIDYDNVRTIFGWPAL